MQNSRYQSRAKNIHGDKFVEQKIPTNLDKETYWKTQIHSRADIEQFYELFYPYFPKELRIALANHIQDQVDGKIPPSEQFYRYSETNQKREQQRWDPQEELQKLRLEGQTNLAMKNMEELMNECRDPQDNDLAVTASLHHHHQHQKKKKTKKQLQ